MRDGFGSLLRRANEEVMPRPRVRLRETLPEIAELRLYGSSGNVFVVIGFTIACLLRAKQPEKADEFKAAALSSKCYADVIKLVHEYLEVI